MHVFGDNTEVPFLIARPTPEDTVDAAVYAPQITSAQRTASGVPSLLARPMAQPSTVRSGPSPALIFGGLAFVALAMFGPALFATRGGRR